MWRLFQKQSFVKLVETEDCLDCVQWKKCGNRLIINVSIEFVYWSSILKSPTMCYFTSWAIFVNEKLAIMATFRNQNLLPYFFAVSETLSSRNCYFENLLLVELISNQY